MQGLFDSQSTTFFHLRLFYMDIDRGGFVAYIMPIAWLILLMWYGDNGRRVGRLRCDCLMGVMIDKSQWQEVGYETRVYGCKTRF